MSNWYLVFSVKTTTSAAYNWNYHLYQTRASFANWVRLYF